MFRKIAMTAAIVTAVALPATEALAWYRGGGYGHRGGYGYRGGYAYRGGYRGGYYRPGYGVGAAAAGAAWDWERQRRVRLQPGPMAAIHATSGTATIGFGRVDLEVREICPSQQRAILQEAPLTADEPAGAFLFGALGRKSATGDNRRTSRHPEPTWGAKDLLLLFCPHRATVTPSLLSQLFQHLMPRRSLPPLGTTFVFMSKGLLLSVMTGAGAAACPIRVDCGARGGEPFAISMLQLFLVQRSKPPLWAPKVNPLACRVAKMPPSHDDWSLPRQEERL